MDIEVVRDRIKALEEFKIKAKEDVCKVGNSFDPVLWFDVDESLFEKYGLDRVNIVSDLYYTEECIDLVINELKMLLEIEGV